MTLLATGVDLCDMRRIERTLERFGDRFLDRAVSYTHLTLPTILLV